MHFVNTAKLALIRWNGQFINYYSTEGATYVDVKAKIIQTAFKQAEFDEATRAIVEAAENGY